MATTDLSDRTVLVAGGTGNVGEGIVRALLTSGARVVVPSGSADRLTTLTGLVGPELAGLLEPVERSYRTFDEAEALAAAVGPVTDLVQAVGGWNQGTPLWEVSEELWQRHFVGPATTHLALVRAFVPRLPPAGSLTLVVGDSAVHPVPTAGPVSMQAAAQMVMRTTLSKELTGGPRVNDLLLGPIRTRSRTRGKKEWLTADQVGSAIAHVLVTPSITGRTVEVETVDALEAFLEEEPQRWSRSLSGS